MMSTRFDICTPRAGRDGKTYWTRIGTAWQSDKGTQLVFDALPIPDAEGRVVANLFEPKPREQSQQRQQKPAFATDYDDDVPGL
jgi:hypothetical protein